MPKEIIKIRNGSHFAYGKQGGFVFIDPLNDKDEYHETRIGAYTTGMKSCEIFVMFNTKTKRTIFLHLDTSGRIKKAGTIDY